GHLDVINTMKEIAAERGLKKALMTFDPHPSDVLDPKKQRTTYLTPFDIKMKKLEELDIDYVFVINFSSAFAGLDKDYFVKEYLISSNIKEVIAGFDYTRSEEHTSELQSRFDLVC